MKKLLILTTVPETLNFFLPISVHLRAKGWQVDGMAYQVSQSAKHIKAFDRVWDVELSRNPLDPRNFLIAPQQIQKLLAEESYDLVNVSSPVAAFVARYSLKNLRKQGKFKIIYTAQGFHFYRGGSPHRNAVFLTLEKLGGLWTDELVVVNHEDEDAAKRYGLIAPDRIHYIPGTGLNVERFNPSNIPETEVIRVRQELGLTPENPLFLCVGEFIPRKRPEDIIRACAKLGRTQVHLAFAGKGILFEEMQQLASNLGLKNQVHFLGLRSDIPILMRASVATILASSQEGLPNCIMESLCAEIPVIGTEIRGTRDLLKNGNGILVKVGNIQALSEAMAWVIEHPEEAKTMGKGGRELMASYDLVPILKLYEELYAEALS